MKRVYIANRGEIAVRIVRACHQLGLEAVVGYSTSDRDTLAVRLADRAVCVGDSRPSQSYLDIERMIGGALLAGCDAVHPGYGFLSESAEFAAACAEHGLIFVGPPAQAIAAMGDKSVAREVAARSGVSVLPGTPPVESLADVDLTGLGFPLLIKAVAGGGGRGIRLVSDEVSLRREFEEGSREAAAAFGDGRLYLERYIPSARHVEVQILADASGNVVHLGTRECSVQRRHQKVLEEAPAMIDESAARRMCDEAVELARHIGYVGAGTVEFVYDQAAREAWFIEMNTRLQVEHGVTELVTGRDIVLEQLRVAGGAPLSFTQDEVVFDGHAIEWRVNAESVLDGFVPMPGLVERWAPPEAPGIRVDTYCEPGSVISPFYDSLLAKLMAHGADRSQAIDRIRSAAGDFEVAGVPTTLELCGLVVDHPDFAGSRIDTHWLEEGLPSLLDALAAHHAESPTPA